MIEQFQYTGANSSACVCIRNVLRTSENFIAWLYNIRNPLLVPISLLKQFIGMMKRYPCPRNVLQSNVQQRIQRINERDFLSSISIFPYWHCEYWHGHNSSTQLDEYCSIYIMCCSTWDNLLRLSSHRVESQIKHRTISTVAMRIE